MTTYDVNARLDLLGPRMKEINTVSVELERESKKSGLKIAASLGRTNAEELIPGVAVTHVRYQDFFIDVKDYSIGGETLPLVGDIINLIDEEATSRINFDNTLGVSPGDGVKVSMPSDFMDLFMVATKSFSVAFNIRFDSLVDTTCILGFTRSGERLAASVTSAGYLRFRVLDGLGLDERVGTNAGGVTTGTDYLVQMSWNHSSQTLRLWLDGIAQGGVGSAHQTGTNGVYIGSRSNGIQSGTIRDMDGGIWDFKVWEDVAHDDVLDFTTTQPDAHYEMNEGDGQSIYDAKGYLSEGFILAQEDETWELDGGAVSERYRVISLGGDTPPYEYVTSTKKRFRIHTDQIAAV